MTNIHITDECDECRETILHDNIDDREILLEEIQRLKDEIHRLRKSVNLPSILDEDPDVYDVQCQETFKLPVQASLEFIDKGNYHYITCNVKHNRITVSYHASEAEYSIIFSEMLDMLYEQLKPKIMRHVAYIDNGK